jgi:osmotically-inducible protein OsmY
LRIFPHPPGCRARYAGLPGEGSTAHPLLSYVTLEGARVVALNPSPADETTEVKTMLRSGMMSDTEVRQEVFRELWLDPRLKRADIGVSVCAGTVTLSGAVTSTQELLVAQEAARRADGVFEVVCEIEVSPVKRPRTDTDIVKAVQHALEWDALIPDRRIQLAVSNGWVALQGRVDLLREREDAERIVRRLEGVRGVYNLIEVKPPEARAENVRDAIGAVLRRHAEREAAGINVSLKEGAAHLTGKVHTWAEKQAILGALKYAPGVERVNDQLSIDPYF